MLPESEFYKIDIIDPSGPCPQVVIPGTNNKIAYMQEIGGKEYPIGVDMAKLMGQGLSMAEAASIAGRRFIASRK